MMEGEFLVEAKEYKLSAIRCMLCVALWIWSVILPWIPLVSVPVALAFILAALHFARYKKEPKWLLRNIEWLRTFYVWLGALAILGGTWAFFLPIAINSGFGKDDDGAALRQALIYTTGGVLGVITLGETHRKNNLEKDKNDQDHTRQVHAERRSRYTKAIEHLFNENISIRLGGVYTLTGLADEWLADEKTLPNKEERRKETQNIINNLCTYIRSPFPLAEQAEQLDGPYAKDLQKDFKGDKEKFDTDKQVFARDKATLEEERQVRESIIKEIRERLQDFGAPGSWSGFDYDFSNALFFYDTDFRNSYFDASSRFSGATFTQDTDFSGTTFTERAPFSGAIFTCTPFSGTTFTERAPFSGAIFTEGVGFFRVTFTQDADFSETTFTEGAPFSGATFLQDANFSGAAFTRDANFFGAKFTGYANFFGAGFTKNANFPEAEFTEANFSGATFTRNANFFRAEFTEADFSGATFTQDADFSGAEFTEASFSTAKFTWNANFSKAKFTEASFSGAGFTKNANFSGAKFTEADFSGAKFTEASFSEAIFEHIPIFRGTEGSNLSIPAKFSCKANSKDYQFKVSPDSPYKIETKEQEHNGIKFVIPKGTELFDPDEPSEQGNNDDN